MDCSAALASWGGWELGLITSYFYIKGLNVSASAELKIMDVFIL
jgi:hypothetical protein